MIARTLKTGVVALETTTLSQTTRDRITHGRLLTQTTLGETLNPKTGGVAQTLKVKTRAARETPGTMKDPQIVTTMEDGTVEATMAGATTTTATLTESQDSTRERSHPWTLRVSS